MKRWPSAVGEEEASVVAPGWVTDPTGAAQSVDLSRALREYHVYLMDCVLCTYLTVWGFVVFCFFFFFFNCTLFVLIRGVKEQFNVNYCWQY